MASAGGISRMKRFLKNSSLPWFCSSIWPRGSIGSPRSQTFSITTSSTTVSPLSTTVARSPTMRMKKVFHSPAGRSAFVEGNRGWSRLFQKAPEPFSAPCLKYSACVVSQICTCGLPRR